MIVHDIMELVVLKNSLRSTNILCMTVHACLYQADMIDLPGKTMKITNNSSDFSEKLVRRIRPFHWVN